MKAITLSQPWATLVATGHKRVETRSWGTHHRGELAIHAGRRVAGLSRPQDFEVLVACWPFASALAEGGYPLERGAIVAVCRLVAVERIACGCLSCVERIRGGGTEVEIAAEQAFGDWRVGRYAWTLVEVRPLRPAPPARGSLGLWEWNPERSAEVPA